MDYKVTAILILEVGLLPMREIVTHCLPLEKVYEGIELVCQEEGVKIVLRPTEFRATPRRTQNAIS